MSIFRLWTQSVLWLLSVYLGGYPFQSVVSGSTIDSRPFNSPHGVPALSGFARILLTLCGTLSSKLRPMKLAVHGQMASKPAVTGQRITK